MFWMWLKNLPCKMTTFKLLVLWSERSVAIKVTFFFFFSAQNAHVLFVSSAPPPKSPSCVFSLSWEKSVQYVNFDLINHGYLKFLCKLPDFTARGSVSNCLCMLVLTIVVLADICFKLLCGGLFCHRKIDLDLIVRVSVAEVMLIKDRLWR